MTPSGTPRIVVLCTVEAGLDTVAELRRRGVVPAALVGLHPSARAREQASGWTDVSSFAEQWDVPYLYVNSYGLTAIEDRQAVEDLEPDLVLVTGWQRLVPDWLIEASTMGVLGVHGSPDGISGGRGRSPQTWAILLGCPTFDLSLFRITPGIDEGPVISRRSFHYGACDDIRVSYFRTALATADMIEEVLANQELLRGGVPQSAEAYYFPQRRPEDGWADFSLTARAVAAHCRALTRPYPGLRCQGEGALVYVWACQPFDGQQNSPPGTIESCFAAGEFLLSCGDGRLLVRDWSTDPSGWVPQPGALLRGRRWCDQLAEIVERHRDRHPNFPINQRIAGALRDVLL